MADTTEDEITIDELGLAEAVQSADDFVVQQNGTTKRVKLQTLDELFHYISTIEQTVKTAVPSGKNEVTITLSNGDTYVFEITNGDGFTGVTITEATGSAEYNVLVFHMSNGVDYTLNVRNGHGISSMSQTKTSTEDEGENTFTFTSTSGATADFTIKNGSKGSKGDTGNRSTITVGTVTTGAAGSSAVVENVGDEHDAVFNFTIPKGDTGDAGTFDTELSDTSENGVQNKVIKAAVDACFKTADIADTVESGNTNAVSSNAVNDTLTALFPVGAIYLNTVDTNPHDILGFGTWVRIGSGRTIWGTSDDGEAGTEIEAGLPNITGSDQMSWYGVHNGVVNNSGTKTGCFTTPDSYDSGNGGASNGNATAPKGIKFDASLSNSIYGNSDTVQPPAIKVNIWNRTA